MTIEFREASKKKPEAVLSKNKIDVINRLLKDILSVLEHEPQRQYLNMFDSDDLPLNSDVSLMLGQIRAAMDAFHEKYFIWSDSHRTKVWATSDNFPSDDDEDDNNDDEGKAS